jgi:hypothetical protein
MCPGPTGRPGLLLLGESSECAGQAVYSTGCAHRKVVCGHKTDGVHRSGGLHRACTSPVLYATRTPPTLTPKQPTGNPNVQRARRLNKPTPSAPLSCSPQSRPPVPELVLHPLFCTSLHLCNSPFVPLCTRGGNSVGGGCRRLTIPPGSKSKSPPPPSKTIPLPSSPTPPSFLPSSVHFLCRCIYIYIYIYIYIFIYIYYTYMLSNDFVKLQITFKQLDFV